MSKYEVPPVSPEAMDHLNNILLRADKELKRQIQTWMQQMDICWCAPVTHGDSARSMEDMQAIIDADPAKFQMVLSDSVAQVAHFMAIDSAAFLAMVEPRHLVDGAYVWGEGLTLVSLRPEWDVQPEDN
jgi:hypothetical protein